MKAGIFWIWAVVVAGLLLKRSIKGPQMWFARSTSLCLLLGVVALKYSVHPDGLVSWAGGILLLVGMITGIAMLSVDIWWMLGNRGDVKQP